MYIRWLIFSCDLLSLYPAVHFLTMWFSGIMAIINNNNYNNNNNNFVFYYVSTNILIRAVKNDGVYNKSLDFFFSQ